MQRVSVVGASSSEEFVRDLANALGSSFQVVRENADLLVARGACPADDEWKRLWANDCVVEVASDASVSETVRELFSLGQVPAPVAPAARTAAVRLRARLLEEGRIGFNDVVAFRDASLRENSSNRSGALRRWVWSVTNNPIKHAEASLMFASYGMEVLMCPFLSPAEWAAAAARQDVSVSEADWTASQALSRLSDEDAVTLGLTGPGRATGAQLEALFMRQLLACGVKDVLIPFAALREESCLLDPSRRRPSSQRHGVRVSNQATLVVWRVMGGTLHRLNYVSFTQGTINLSKRDRTLTPFFGWDDVFCPDGANGLSFHELKARGLKVSARQRDISSFLSDFIHYKEGKDLRWAPQHPKECVDFGVDAAAVLQQYGHALLPYMISALNDGLYFRFPENRRHGNYFFTPVAGLPATPKDDSIHEKVFQAHDVGHFAIQELCYSGLDHSYLARAVFVAVRMLSEAMTMILADMYVVDGLVRGGVQYDWKKRAIWPVFEATGLSFSPDPAATLLRLIRANADCLLKGDDGAFRDLIEQNGGDLATLHRFKDKYSKFFTSDFEWAVSNWANLAENAAANRRWWQRTEILRDASGLLFESEVEFLRRSPGLTECATPSDIIDACLTLLFERQIAPHLATAAATPQQQLLPRFVRTSRAGTRYLIGQMAVFAHFAFVDTAATCAEEVEELTLQLIAQTRAWQNLEDSSERLAWVLDQIARARRVVSEFLHRLVSFSLICESDRETYDAQFPLFKVHFLSYDKEAKDYVPVKQTFEREFSRAVRLERMNASFRCITGRTDDVAVAAALVEGSGGLIDDGTFVLRPGRLALAPNLYLVAGGAPLAFLALQPVVMLRRLAPLVYIDPDRDEDEQKLQIRQVMPRYAGDLSRASFFVATTSEALPVDALRVARLLHEVGAESVEALIESLK